MTGEEKAHCGGKDKMAPAVWRQRWMPVLSLLALSPGSQSLGWCLPHFQWLSPPMSYLSGNTFRDVARMYILGHFDNGD